MYLKKSNFGNGFSYRESVTVSNNVHDCAKRDLTYLSEMGVTAEYLSKLKEKIDALNSLQSYKDSTAKKAIVTEERNDSKYQLVVNIKRLRSQLFYVYSVEAGKYVALFTKGLSNLSPIQLVDVGYDMLEAFKDVAPEELSLYGVTPERIAEFEAEVKALQSNDQEQKFKTGAINNATDERKEAKESVFKMLQFVCNVGKTYWTPKQKGLYSDYVITKPKKQSNKAATITSEDLSTPVETGNTEVF